MHLYWEMPPAIETGPIVACSAVCEVLVAPRVPITYFWALQAGFTDGADTDHGAAHLGLQHYPPHPGSRAVNWGGYPPAHSNWQTVLDGSRSPLPSATDDPNTRDFAWEPLRPYRFRISKSDRRGWRGTVTDVATDTETHVRDLYAGGDRLRGLVVWSEWFCPCDAPTVIVRWSGFAAETAAGEMVRPHHLYVNHPAEGCANVGHVIERDGPDASVQQIINTVRTVAHGTRIAVDSPSPH